MISKDFINHWRKNVNWLFDRQVEQDLIISRALVELYTHPDIQSSLAFRGGTALFSVWVYHPKPQSPFTVVFWKFRCSDILSGRAHFNKI